jgi:hypothetical protein
VARGSYLQEIARRATHEPRGSLRPQRLVENALLPREGPIPALPSRETRRPQASLRPTTTTRARELPPTSDVPIVPQAIAPVTAGAGVAADPVGVAISPPETSLRETVQPPPRRPPPPPERRFSEPESAAPVRDDRTAPGPPPAEEHAPKATGEQRMPRREPSTLRRMAPTAPDPLAVALAAAVRWTSSDAPVGMTPARGAAGDAQPRDGRASLPRLERPPRPAPEAAAARPRRTDPGAPVPRTPPAADTHVMPERAPADSPASVHIGSIEVTLLSAPEPPAPTPTRAAPAPAPASPLARGLTSMIGMRQG